MKKLFIALALLTLSTVGYTKEVVSAGDNVIFIVDGKKVYWCNYEECILVSSDYTKAIKL